MRDLGPSEHGETRTACDFRPCEGGRRGGEGRRENKNNASGYYILVAAQRDVLTETMLRAGYGNKDGESANRQMLKRRRGGIREDRDGGGRIREDRWMDGWMDVPLTGSRNSRPASLLTKRLYRSR